MPYYVYKIGASVSQLVKNLDLVGTYDNFKEAKNFAKEQRMGLDKDDAAQVKVMFAENQLEAEEKLMEHREQPIVREWEK